MSFKYKSTDNSAININFNHVDFKENLLFSVDIINILADTKNNKRPDCYHNLHKQRDYTIFYKLITIYRRLKIYFKIVDA